MRELETREIEAHNDKTVLDRLEELEVVVRGVVGGGFEWSDDDGYCDGRTYPSYREAAWAAVTFITGETPEAARQAGEVSGG